MLDVHIPTTDGRELVRTRYTEPERELKLLLERLDVADLNVLASRLRELGLATRNRLASEQVAEADRDIRYSLGLRYEGQAHELDVSVVPEHLDRDALARDFSARYFDAWSYAPTNKPIQLVTLRVAAIGRAPKLSFPRRDRGARKLAGAQIARRDVFFAGSSRPTPIYERARLPVDMDLRGLAIFEEAGSTTVVFPEWGARMDEVGNIILD